MDAFFEYLNFVTTSGFLQDFVAGISSMFNWMFTTVTIFGTEYSILSLVLGNAITAYWGFTIIRYFLPF